MAKVGYIDIAFMFWVAAFMVVSICNSCGATDEVSPAKPPVAITTAPYSAYLLFPTCLFHATLLPSVTVAKVTICNILQLVFGLMGLLHCRPQLPGSDPWRNFAVP